MAEIEKGVERCLMITVKDTNDEESHMHVFMENDCDLDLHEVFEVVCAMGFGKVC